MTYNHQSELSTLLNESESVAELERRLGRRVAPHPLFEEEELCQYLLKNITAKAPLTILKSYNGNGLFTRKDIPANTEIYRSTPFLTSIDVPLTGAVCDHCHTRQSPRTYDDGWRTPHDKVSKITLCTRCKMVGWCSEDCMNKAWSSYHHLECVLLKKLAVDSDDAKGLVRLVMLHHHNLLDAKTWIAFNRLEKHPRGYCSILTYRRLKRRVERLKLFTNSGLCVKRLLDVCCRVMLNRVEICSAESAALGRRDGWALDVVTALINHDCDPNVHVFFEGNQIIVRSLKKIKAGKELLRSYVDVNESVNHRWSTNVGAHFFVCKCKRCCTDSGQLQAWAIANQLTFEQTLPVEREIRNFVDEMPIADNIEDIAKKEKELEQVFQNALGGVGWPRHICPIYMTNHHFSFMYARFDNLAQSIKHAIIWGFAHFSTTKKYGIARVVGMYNMLLPYENLLSLLEEPSLANETDCPTREQFETFNHGLLYEVMVQAYKNFGDQTPFFKAIHHLYKEKESAGSECPAASAKSVASFQSAQTQVIKWLKLNPKSQVTLTPRYSS